METNNSTKKFWEPLFAAPAVVLVWSFFFVLGQVPVLGMPYLTTYSSSDLLMNMGYIFTLLLVLALLAWFLKIFFYDPVFVFRKLVLGLKSNEVKTRNKIAYLIFSVLNIAAPWVVIIFLFDGFPLTFGIWVWALIVVLRIVADSIEAKLFPEFRLTSVIDDLKEGLSLISRNLGFELLAIILVLGSLSSFIFGGLQMNMRVGAGETTKLYFIDSSIPQKVNILSSNSTHIAYEKESEIIIVSRDRLRSISGNRQKN